LSDKVSNEFFETVQILMTGYPESTAISIALLIAVTSAINDVVKGFSLLYIYYSRTMWYTSNNELSFIIY
jgi:hypothetical protein